MKLPYETLADIAPVVLDHENVMHRILTDVDGAGMLSTRCGRAFGARFRHTYRIALRIATDVKHCKECWKDD